MIKKWFFLGTSILFLAVAGHGESTNRLHFAGTAFSIVPLDPPMSESSQQVLMMCLPANDGFSGNVNVMVQPFAGSIEDYLALSKKQFKNANLTVLNQKIIGKAAIIEYSGDIQGKALHFYARAEKAGGKVYLVTATAPDDQWSAISPKLKSCVDSFRCD